MPDGVYTSDLFGPPGQQVRKAPNWPRRRANCSPFFTKVLHSIVWPTRIVWADLTPFFAAQVQVITLDTRSFRDDLIATSDLEPGCGWVAGPSVGPQVRKTPTWPKSWANSSLF